MVKRRYLMQKKDGSIIDIESYFKGIIINEITGMNERGSAKNIYISDWVNSNEKDIYIPDVICYNSKDVTITYTVTDADMYLDVVTINDTFINYVSGETILYDTYRGKKNTLIFSGGEDIASMRLHRQSGSNMIKNTIKLIKKYNIDEDMD